jgi:hypothetical protein
METQEICELYINNNRINKDDKKLSKKSTYWDNSSIIHYLHIACCFLYFKSFSQCDSNFYECDFYYDKFTILYKLIMIVISGIITGILIFVSLLNYNHKKAYVYILESIVFPTTYFSFNFFITRKQKHTYEVFEYSGELLIITILITLIILMILYFVYKIPKMIIYKFFNIKKILLAHTFLLNFYSAQQKSPSLIEL